MDDASTVGCAPAADVPVQSPLPLVQLVSISGGGSFLFACLFIVTQVQNESQRRRTDTQDTACEHHTLALSLANSSQCSRVGKQHTIRTSKCPIRDADSASTSPLAWWGTACVALARPLGTLERCCGRTRLRFTAAVVSSSLCSSRSSRRGCESAYRSRSVASATAAAWGDDEVDFDEGETDSEDADDAGGGSGWCSHVRGCGRREWSLTLLLGTELLLLLLLVVVGGKASRMASTKQRCLVFRVCVCALCETKNTVMRWRH